MPRPRWRSAGFTTQEPWIPILIVIILAMIAFVTLRGIGRESRMRIAVLHSLAMIADAQETYHRAHRVYAGSVGPNDAPGAITVVPDSGALLTITHADSNGWAAEGTHPVLSRGSRKCYIFGGTAPHDPRLRQPAEPVCW